MRRKRRRIQYYNGAPTRERLRDKPWLPAVILVAVALVAALLVGTVLGNVAQRSRREGVNWGDLLAYGGVSAEKRYDGLYPVRSDHLSLSGLDENEFSRAMRELPDGNGVSFLLYDGQGGVYFDAELAKKTDGWRVLAPITPEEIGAAASDRARYAVGFFVTGAFRETDEQLRLLAVAREIALLRELSSSGIGEVVVLGLPEDVQLADAVQSYVRQADEALGNVLLGVAVGTDVTVTARTVALTEAYADAFYLDARALADEALGRAITSHAYYLTYYNMRLMRANTDRETALGVADGFGLAACVLAPRQLP